MAVQRRPTQSVQYYYCPMHPDYVATERGACPICGMELVPVGEKPPRAGRREERVPVAIESEQQRVLGVSVDDVRSVSLDRTIHATGHVLMAPPVRMPAPEAGIVEEVYQNPGTSGSLRIRAAEPILSLAGDSSSHFIIRAPGPLVLLSVPQPGFRLEKGKEACGYVDLSTIYVLAEIRSADLPFIRPGLQARATFPASPGKRWQGSIMEASGQFDERMQTLKVKLEFQNDQLELWQGMFANIEIESRTARVLAIPESAVITDGEAAVVFVEQPGGVFEPRKIETGLRAQSLVEVTRGLSKGDRVVTAATFLLDSESRLRALAPTGHRR